MIIIALIVIKRLLAIYSILGNWTIPDSVLIIASIRACHIFCVNGTAEFSPLFYSRLYRIVTPYQART
jgi:hypothetical protein